MALSASYVDKKAETAKRKKFMFTDRKDAGLKLARALAEYRRTDAVVLAIPRGGVEVGFHVAKQLDLGFSIIVSRKLPFPNDPEAGFGAVSEDGSTFIRDDASSWITEETIRRIVEEQKEEVRRRISALRQGKPLPDIGGKRVILVDDGIAMGSTMRVSIETCRNRGAGSVVVAVPVAGERTLREFARLADRIVALEIPRFFRAVAQVYEHWYDVPDSEVLRFLSAYPPENT
jgi:putative phosphoribosyl transferase